MSPSVAVGYGVHRGVIGTAYIVTTISVPLSPRTSKACFNVDLGTHWALGTESPLDSLTLGKGRNVSCRPSGFFLSGFFIKVRPGLLFETRSHLRYRPWITWNGSFLVETKVLCSIDLGWIPFVCV